MSRVVFVSAGINGLVAAHPKEEIVESRMGLSHREETELAGTKPTN
jgi:hypothetical protein